MKSQVKEFVKLHFTSLYLHKYEKYMQEKIRKNQELKNLSFEKKIEDLENRYKKRLGRKLNLTNPTDWNEKMQWLKLYDATLEKSKFTDKIIAKKLVADKIGEKYVVPLLHSGVKTFDELNFDILPDQFVLKTNHGSGNVIIVKDKKKFLSTNRWKIAQSYLKHWMQMDYGYDDGYEFHYSAINPLIFAEAYIPALEHEIKEYRILCFEGYPKYIKVKTIKSDGTMYRNIYDTKWNFRDVEFGFPQTDIDPKPKALEEMLFIAQQLSDGFHFVRVDLNYHPNYGIYFGEMTFTSDSGFTKIQPYSFCKELGDLIKIDEIICGK